MKTSENNFKGRDEDLKTYGICHCSQLATAGGCSAPLEQVA